MNATSISPAEFAQQCRGNTSIELIDVRTPVEFREVHLAMARNVPLDRLDAAALIQARNGTSGQPLYVICHAGTRGRKACEKLQQAGLANVINIDGGTQACVAAGLPVIRGKKAISIERQVRIVAGALVLLGCGLSLVHPAFIGLAAFVGGGLFFAGVTDFCGMGLLLARMPWNQCDNSSSACVS